MSCYHPWCAYRDGRCVECGATEDLHAHHIKSKSEHPELKLDVDNGKTLCYRCHKKEHERNRPNFRIRVGRKPQRKTLEKKIEWLNQQLHESEAKITNLTKKLVILTKMVHST